MVIKACCLEYVPKGLKLLFPVPFMTPAEETKLTDGFAQPAIEAASA